jgi:RHS repeat-associated protein
VKKYLIIFISTLHLFFASVAYPYTLPHTAMFTAEFIAVEPLGNNQYFSLSAQPCNYYHHYVTYYSDGTSVTSGSTGPFYEACGTFITYNGPVTWLYNYGVPGTYYSYSPDVNLQESSEWPAPGSVAFYDNQADLQRSQFKPNNGGDDDGDLRGRKIRSCKTSPPPIDVGLPVNIATGNMYHIETDFQFSDVLTLNRTYNSYGDTANDPAGYLPRFGASWSFIFGTGISSVPGGKRVLAPSGKWRVYMGSDSTGYSPRPGTKATLAYTGSGYIETLYTGTKNYFDSQGKLTKVRLATGRTVTVDYSQQNYIYVTSDLGKTIKLHLDTNGNIDQAKDPAGRYYNYTYDAGNLASVEFPDGSTKNYLYESPVSADLLTSITITRNGQTKTLAQWSYNSSGYCTSSSTDGTDDSVTLSYNTSTNTTTVTDSLNNTSTYTYQHVNEGIIKTGNIAGNCGCTSASGSYDSNGNVTTKADKNGNITALSGYDSKGNPGTIVEKDSQGSVLRTTTYTYHSATGDVASKTRASVFSGYPSAKRTYAYDSSNMLTGTHATGFTHDIDGNTLYRNYSTSHTYNTHEQPVYSTDTRGNGTVFGYYSTVWGTYSTIHPNHGMLHTATNALNQTVTFGDYSSGKAGWSRDANGILTTNSYDARGRLKSVTVHQRTTSYGYDAYGNMTSMRLPSGKRIGYEYDGANRLTKVRDGLGNYIAYGYDTESNRTSEEIHDASGALVKYRNMDYNADNRLWHTFNSYSSTESGYDNKGNLTSIRDMNGNTTSYRYDPLDRMKAVIQPSPGVGFGNISTTYTYDINDNVKSVTDGRGNTTTYVYDDFSRLVEVDSPDTGTTRYEYDAAGNMTKKKDAAGTLVSYSYDELNRLTFIDYPGTDEDITYTYDQTASGYYNIGRMTSMTDASGSISYYYDEYGEMVKEVKTFTDLPGKSFITEYSYDADGNLWKLEYPDGRLVTYSYDNAGRVSSVTSLKDGTHKVFADSVTHKPSGGLSAFTFGNGLTAQRTYDLDYRLSYLKSGPMLRRDYAYDNAGNITGITDLVHPEKSQSIGYDKLHRLTSATGPYGSIGYEYDAVGNRQSKTTGAGITNYTYNYNGTNNKLASATGVEAATYGYDGNGNMTSDGVRTYAYNLNSRLISASEGGQAIGDYVYDGMGRRVKKTAGGKTTYFIYDSSGKLISEYDGSGTWVSNRVYLDGEPLARLDAGQQNPQGPAASPSGDSVCLTWEQVAGADSYIACRGTSPGSYFECTSSINATSYCFGNITGTSLQYFRVTAYDSGGNAIGESFVDGVTLAPPNPELPHYAYNAVLGGQANCAICHLTPGTFAAGFGVRTSIGLCISCHNAAGVGHAKGDTGGHPVFVNVTADALHNMPGFGSTTGMGSDSVGAHLLYGGQVVCMSCHNAMEKPNDPGRTWEFTNFTGGVTYSLQHGGWSYYSYLKPAVYRTASAMSAPANIQDRQAYEVAESEYDVYPVSGEVVFHQAQDAGTYIYVTLGNDYLRTANALNALCLDCHAISTHKGVNCAICHGTHGTDNLYDVRGRLGTPGGYADVAFTSMTAMGGGHGVCTVCHTTTMYHNVTSLSPVEHYDNQVCVDCHPHRSGFPSFTSVWNPVKRWFAELLGADTAYAKPPAWVTDGSLPPGLANHSLPDQAWENGLKKFKVSFEIVRKGASNENSGQSGIKDDIIMYYHNDHLGTPCFLTDEKGSIVWRREQTPFGEKSFERGTTTENLRFPGQYWDEETGLAQNWHRDYNAQLGRYVEADPIGQVGGVNLLTYAGNNSINKTDPNGETLIAAGLVAGVSLAAATAMVILYKKCMKDCMPCIENILKKQDSNFKEWLEVDPNYYRKKAYGKCSDYCLRYAGLLGNIDNPIAVAGSIAGQEAGKALAK